MIKANQFGKIKIVCDRWKVIEENEKRKMICWCCWIIILLSTYVRAINNERYKIIWKYCVISWWRKLMKKIKKKTLYSMENIKNQNKNVSDCACDTAVGQRKKFSIGLFWI